MNKNLKKILDTLTIIKEKTINFLSKAFDSIKNTAKKTTKTVIKNLISCVNDIFAFHVKKW